MMGDALEGFAADRARVYDAILRVQAAMLYPFERPIYQSPSWRAARTVLDYGCGNGCYLATVAADFADKRFVALEPEPALRAAAQSRLPALRIEATGEALAGQQFDALLFRLVFMHMGDRAPAMATIEACAAAGACLIVIEADDRLFDVDPMPPRFRDAMLALRGKSVDRGAATSVEPELARLGFTPAERMTVVPNSTFPHVRELMAQYLWLACAYGVADRPDSRIADELLAFSATPSSYFQFGEVLTVYRRA